MSKRSNLISKDVKYVNKDFGEFRQSLIDFSRNYTPVLKKAEKLK